MRYGTGAQACTVSRTAWFPVAESLTTRIRLAHSYSLGGVYLWTPTYLDARAWNSIEALRKEGLLGNPSS